MRDSSYLFGQQAGSWAIIDHQQKELAKHVSQLSETDCTREDAVDEITERFSINVPTTDDNSASASQTEVDIDVSRDPNRYFSIPGQPHLLRGLRITISVSFSGDEIFFRLRPDTYGTMPPIGEVRDGSLIFATEGVSLDGDKVRIEYQAWLSSVKQHLEWHRSKYISFNHNLRASVAAALADRISKLRKNDDVLEKLGLPLQAPRHDR